MSRPTMQSSPRSLSGERLKSAKYLTFHLGSEEFAIDVIKVKEIIGVQDITAVPHTPHYVSGVINLRGKVIPVLDLRRKLGLPEAPDSPHRCIVVVQPDIEHGTVLSGLIVDGVSEVLTLSSAEIEPTPDFGEGIHIRHVLGIAKPKGKVKIVLDVDPLVMSDIDGSPQAAGGTQDLRYEEATHSHATFR
ncbi:MAG TPA: chemotaxis protein CheW [Bryobacteraceae bacterium]|nr:chemotaxis protein CheW [Bryobacteraceae bacterium]